jgi:hypothetical protein
MLRQNVPYILHCGLKATQKVCDVGSLVATVCPSLLLTSEGLHIPHLSKPRTNDRWWLDCRKQKLQFACWLLKRRRKGIVHKGMVASQQPLAIYTIQPLYESPPPPPIPTVTISSVTILNPGAVVVLALWKVSKHPGDRLVKRELSEQSQIFIVVFQWLLPLDIRIQEGSPTDGCRFK